MPCGDHLPQSIDKVERARLSFSKQEMDPNQPWWAAIPTIILFWNVMPLNVNGWKSFGGREPSG